MQLKNVEDLYSLSPMQENMLFHTCTHIRQLESGSLSSEDVLLNQVKCQFIGELDLVAFQYAWQYVLDRHASLRSAFVWQGLKQPKQVVRKKLIVPFEIIDLSHLTAEKQLDEQNAILIKDKQSGFDPLKAPLFRVTVIKLAEHQHKLVWTNHHLVLDRWCIPIVFSDLQKAYQSYKYQLPLDTQPATSFKRYISWLNKLPPEKSIDFWLQQLVGYSQSHSHSICQPVGNEARTVLNSEVMIESRQYTQLKRFCVSQQITPATLIQSAWGMILAQSIQANDIVFGVVVSGRPANVVDVENIVGSFVNNLPVRFKFEENEPIIRWLKNIQRFNYARLDHEHVSPNMLKRMTDLPADKMLFDNILIWLANTSEPKLDEIKVHSEGGIMNTTYPLTISIEEKAGTLVLRGQIRNGFKTIEPLPSILSKWHELVIVLVNSSLQTKFSEVISLPPFDKNTAKGVSKERVSQQKALLLQPESSIAHNDKLEEGREQTKLMWVLEFLAEEWKNLLGVNCVNPDDDFFTLGGNSLKAAQLQVRIEQTERRKIPLLSLFKYSSLEGMAQTIIEKNWPLNPQIVTPLNQGGDLLPVFCIASADVNTLGYANLAKYIPSDVPFYLVQALPSNNLVEQLKVADITKYATQYINAIKKVQPNPPYRFIGMCDGAYIMQDMIRQLDKAGESTSFIGIINTWAFFTVSKWYRLIKAKSHVYIYWQYYKQRLRDFRMSEVKALIIRKFGNIKHNPTQLGTIESTPLKPEQQKPYYIFDYLGWAHLEQKIEKVNQKVTVFRCKNQPFWRTAMPCLGWRKHITKVEVVDIEGKVHTDILRQQHVRSFAKHLNAKLLETNYSKSSTNQLGK